MRTAFDATDEGRGTSGPFIADTDVIGLYHPDQAAAVARASMTDQGSGQRRQDD